ncbi:MAG TPA: hypothetical protein VFQ35_15255 [Polyangiaceae bacterium]|nr:hypothetical protein [Polyangiaceae bacterium]
MPRPRSTALCVVRGSNLLATLSFGALLAMTQVAAAQSRAGTSPAQALFDEAKALMQAGRAEEACPKLEESQRLEAGSGTLLNLGLCYEQTGRLASAWSTYIASEQAARARGKVDRAAAAHERAEALAPQLSRLTIEVPLDARPSGFRIERDGVELDATQWNAAIPLDGGSHSVRASAPGFHEWRESIVVPEKNGLLTLRVPALTPIASPPPTSAPRAEPPRVKLSNSDPSALPPQRVAALVAGGVGVAGVAVGAIYGLRAISKKQQADETCTDGVCTTPGGVRAGKDAHAAGNVATVASVIGVLGLAGGAVLWFTTPHTERSTRVGLGFGSVQLEGRF